MITPKTKSLATLTKELDGVFSEYIRRKYSINGFCYCFICSKRMKISEAQNGHYVDRDQMMTRYDEVNCNAVCFQCNVLDDDHRSRYRIALIDRYGIEEVKRLELSSYSLRKFMRHELIEMIEDFKLRIKQLKK